MSFVISEGEITDFNISGKEIHIPEGVRQIGWRVFSGNFSHKSIELLESLEQIDKGAFF